MKKIFVILNIATLLATSFSTFGADQAEVLRHTDSHAKEREYASRGGAVLGVPAAASTIRIDAQNIEASQSVGGSGGSSSATNNSKAASTRAAMSKSGKQPLRFNPAPE